MRGHPITRVGILLLLFRLGGLAVRDLGQPDSPLPARLALFVPGAAAHVGALLIVIAAWLLVATAFPRCRRTITIGACTSFAVLMVAGQADFVVSSITGAPLTPTVFRTFRGLHVVASNEFLEPLRVHLAATLSGAGLFLAAVGWMATVIRQSAIRGAGTGAGSPYGTGTGAGSPYGTGTEDAVLHGAGLDRGGPLGGRGGHRPSLAALVAFPAALAGFGSLLMVLAAAAPWPPPAPIEVAFAREYLHLDAVRLRGSAPDAYHELRRIVGLPPGASWASDDYPLVYRPPTTMAAARRRRNLPDIVVVMIESLRAAELDFATGAPASATPSLDRLAARSVVFPTFISNGFPSAPSVLAFHSSAWPHRRKEIITDFADRTFESIPLRLAGLGYEAIYVGADPHFDNQDRWLPRWYEQVLDLVAQGVPATDRNIVTRAIEEVRQHDRLPSGKPLFEFVSTYSTHYPFTLPPDAGETPVGTNGGLTAQYRQTLHYTDREVGRLLAFLDARHRRTVIVVLGDHGFYMNLRRVSGMPENDTVWTAALIAGPEDLVGPPRRLAMPASHVDVLPTLLAIVGDDRPSASVGSDLLGAPRTGVRTALAIRPGGLRFDRDGYSLMIDGRQPNVVLTRMPFPSLQPPSASPPGFTPAQLTDWTDDWSYLVEKNRVWNDAFLHPASGSNNPPPSGR